MARLVSASLGVSRPSVAVLCACSTVSGFGSRSKLKVGCVSGSVGVSLNSKSRTGVFSSVATGVIGSAKSSLNSGAISTSAAFSTGTAVGSFAVNVNSKGLTVSVLISGAGGTTSKESSGVVVGAFSGAGSKLNSKG
ncbi:hypothetical protein D3C75_1012930 [compost metagenome]